MPAYAHSLPNHPPDHWEPLFTPFRQLPTDDPAAGCSGRNGQPCLHCETLDRKHGHLNKVAWWAAKFAGDMFPTGPDRDTARQWAYLAGLWHDLGKFAPKWQEYLRSKADPHEPVPRHNAFSLLISSAKVHRTLHDNLDPKTGEIGDRSQLTLSYRKDEREEKLQPEIIAGF